MGADTAGRSEGRSGLLLRSVACILILIAEIETVPASPCRLADTSGRWPWTGRQDARMTASFHVVIWINEVGAGSHA